MTSLLEKIQRIDRRIIYLILLILIIWPLLAPWGLPIHVDDSTVQYYDAIQSLAPGSTVFISYSVSAQPWGELGPLCIATYNQLFERHIKFVMAMFETADAQIVFETMLLPNLDTRGAKYGVDWVNLGFIAGQEVARAAVARDFLYPGKDAYGSSLADLPLLKQVKSIDDVAYYVGLGNPMVDMRQMCVPYKKEALVGITSIMYPDIAPYVQAKVVRGLVNGLVGGGQYEYLLKKPGLATRGNDAISATHIFLLGLVIVTNIAFVISPKEERAKLSPKHGFEKRVEGLKEVE